MSSFYGNIKFNNQTPLVFDKIYPSRWEMEKNCHSDGIFHGRYILISYGDIRYTPYHKIGRITEAEFNAHKADGTILYVAATGEGAVDGFISSNTWYYDNEYYVKTVYALDDTSVFADNKKDDEINYHHEYHNTVWQKIWTSTQDSAEIEEKYIMVSHLNAETPKLTMIVDAPNDSMDINSQTERFPVYFLVPTDEEHLNIAGRITQEDFDINKDQLYVKEKEGDPIKPVGDGKWNITYEYYTQINDVYRKVVDSNPYVDGMISRNLFEYYMPNLRPKYFNKDDPDYENIPMEQRPQPIKNLYVLDDNNQYKVTAEPWDVNTKYYFRRLRENEGRPHFDPIMSTDLEYLFHMPRNWKFNNETDFDYNVQGYDPENIHYDDTENKISLIEHSTPGVFYPVHRKDEPSSAQYKTDPSNPKELIMVTSELPDTKKFRFDLQKLGNAVAQMWDKVYPKMDDDANKRNTFIGNDRDPDNGTDYPRTLAEAVRKLYYWLGIKSDNNFTKGPWVDPTTGEEIDTIFGVLNGASDLLGTFEDDFDINLFIPIAHPYYPDGYGKRIGDVLNEAAGTVYEGLSPEEFDKLHNGGAGPLYVQVGVNQYEHAKVYDKNTQYYRNMNSLLSILKEWQEAVKEKQGDWIVEIDEDWNENNPSNPRFIHNKPVVLSVDRQDASEGSINWYWNNYAI